MLCNIYEREYWYNYVDIDLLLKHECKNQYIVCDAASSDALHQNHIINNAINQLKINCKVVKSAVIPINIGISNNGIYEGLHWVGLLIKLNSNEEVLEALYSDSFGNNIDDILLSVLHKSGIIDIKNLSKKQQYNEFDCGPWVVFNLKSLATTGKLATNINENMILNQRLTLRQLLSKYKNELNSSDAPGFSGNKSIFTHSMDFPEDSVQLKIKENDINILLKMTNMISSFLNNQISLHKCLLELGDLTEKISYNDTKDPHSYHIRNKYGYIQRNKNKKINNKGIYFEKISQLKIIFSDETISSCINENEKNGLESDLINLNEKLLVVLTTENQSLKENEIFSDEIFIHQIISIADKYYEKIIFRKIQEVIRSIDVIDFNIREDRYFFARIFTIVGQLLNEFLENQLTSLSNNQLLIGFQNLVNIRNLVVHYHVKIKFFNENEKILTDINESITVIKYHLNKLITGNFKINIEYENSKLLVDSTKLILSYLKNKSKSNSNESTTKESIKIDINDLVIKSYKIIERMGSMLTDTEQLIQLNNKYQILLNQFPIYERKTYPDKLNVSNKTIIKEYFNLNQYTINNKKVKLYKTKQKESESKSNPCSDKNKIFSSLDNLLWKSYKIISDNNIDKTEINKNLSSINNQYQSILNKLELPERENYPHELNYENKNIIIKYNEPKIKELVTKLIVEINEEMFYFEYIENNFDLNPFKKTSIIEHIILVIGQNVRELHNLSLCNFKDVNLPDEKWFLSRCISSEIFTEASQSVRRSRNEGLAHQILNVDNLNLWKVIINDILPAKNYLEKLFNMNKEEMLPLSVYSSYALGIAFTDIGLYKRAIDYLQKALNMVDSLSVNDSILISDKCNNICGMNSLKFQISVNLAHVYRLNGHYQEATKLLSFLVSKINYKEAISCNDETLKRNICNVYIDISYLHLFQFDYKKIIELCEKAILISDNFEIKYYLIIACWEDGQTNKAIELLGNIKENNNDCIKSIMFIETMAFMCLDKLEMEKYYKMAVKCVREMEQLMENNINYFKENNPHGYLLEKLVISYIKCKILASDALKYFSYNISSLENIIETTSEIIKKLNDDLKRDRLISYIYICFCKGYLNYFFLNEKELNIILKAQKHFDNATETFNNFVEPLEDVVKELISAAEAISDSYIILSKNVDINTQIIYLNKSLILQEKYSLNKMATFHRLAKIYFNLGIELYIKHMDDKQREYFDNALLNFSQSIKFCKLKKKERITDNVLKIIDIMDEINDKILEHVEMETTKFLAMCYNRIGVLKYDIFLLIKSVKHYNKLIDFSIPADAKIYYEKQRNKCQERITSVTSTLEYLVSQPNRVKCLVLSDYALEFLFAKFPDHINEENCQSLFDKSNPNLIDDLRSHFKQELNKFSNEFIILLKFYKTLVKVGIIKGVPVNKTF